MTIRSTLRRRVAAASAAAMLTITGAGLLGIPAAHAAATGYTTASVTVRSGTNTSTAALTTIPAGVAVSVQCQTAGQTINGTYSTNYWGKVTYGGKTGYVSRAYVRVPDATGLGACGTSTPAPSTGVTGYATASLTVRAGTNTGTTALATIPSGTAIKVQCQTPGQTVNGTYSTHYWGKVTYGGKTGYVSRAYVRVPDATGLKECTTSAPAPDISAARQRVLDRGMNWVNRRVPYSMYSYAAGPDADGYRWRTDCSGMIAMAYNLRDQNYYTGNLTSKFYPIAKSSLQRGDIIGNLGDPASAGAAGHVVIFNGWTDSSMTQFRTIEQAGGIGATQQTRTWGNSFWNKQGYRFRGW